jgi:hypothetical protein
MPFGRTARSETAVMALRPVIIEQAARGTLTFFPVERPPGTGPIVVSLTGANGGVLHVYGPDEEREEPGVLDKPHPDIARRSATEVELVAAPTPGRWRIFVRPTPRQPPCPAGVQFGGTISLRGQKLQEGIDFVFSANASSCFESGPLQLVGQFRVP